MIRPSSPLIPTPSGPGACRLKLRWLNSRGHREDTTTTSVALRPFSFPALSGIGSGLATQASPQLGRGMRGLETLRVSTLPPAGQGIAALFAGPTVGPAASTPSPSPRAGSGRSPSLSPSPIWGRPAQLQGKSKGLERPWILKGKVRPPRRPWSRLVPPAPPTRTLLRQGPVPHLSKSEVSRLADQDTGLGLGMKLLTYPEELGFLTTRSGAEFRRGRSGDLCTCSA